MKDAFQILNSLARQFLSSAILCGLPIYAVAQVDTLAVRAGEHSDFTRLVVLIEPGSPWGLAQDGAEATLSLPLAVGGFDLSQTFRRIPRTRLAALRQSPGKLELTLACACNLTAFEDLPGVLVIDITGAPGTTLAPIATTIRPRPRPAHLTLAPGELQTNPAAIEAGLNVARRLRGVSAPTPQPNLLVEQIVPVAHLVDVAQPPAGTNNQDEATLFQQQLGHVIAQALHDGLLSPSANLDGADAAAEENRAPLPSLVSSPVGTTLRSAVSHMIPQPEDTHSKTCAPLEVLDIRTWGNADGTYHPPYDLLSRLYGEFDQMDVAAMSELIKHYLHYGFGLEAAVLLENDAASIPHADLWRQLADVVDLAPPGSPQVLADLAGCSEIGDLWAAFAEPVNSDTPEVRLNNILSAASDLPEHLRRHLAPRLIQMFSDADAPEHAHRLLSAVKRSPTLPDPALALASAILAERVAPETLPAHEASLSPDHSVEDVLFMLDRRLALGHAPDDTLIAQTLEHLHAARRSPHGRALAVALTRAYATRGAFANALALIEREDTGLTRIDRLELQSEIFAAVHSAGSDNDFILTIFDAAPWDRDGLPQSLLRSLARRLGDLGFHEQAALLEDRANAVDGFRQFPAADMAPRTTAPDPAEADPEQDLPDQMSERAIPSTDVAQNSLPFVPQPAPPRRPSFFDVAPGEIAQRAEQTDGVNLIAEGRERIEQSRNLRGALRTLLDESEIILPLQAPPPIGDKHE